MIDTTDSLQHFLADKMNDGISCAIDTEADSLHHYYEKLCLVQFYNGKESVLIDPLQIEDTSLLSQYLSQATCWMHGGDYDMHMLSTHLHVVPPVVFDTQIGARLLGVRRFSYADLVKRYEGVELEKGSQKADWSKRPLTACMRKYAINDVLYLLEMAEKIVAELREKGRYGWFVESCQAARNKVINRCEELEEEGKERWRIKGCGKFEAAELRFLKILWEWRDKEASLWDKPPFMVVTNKVLLEWVRVLVRGDKVSYPHYFRTRWKKTLMSSIEEGYQQPREQWPQRFVKRRAKVNEDFHALMAQLIERRNQQAKELGIEPSLIAPRWAIEKIASKKEEAHHILLSWQRELLTLS